MGKGDSPPPPTNQTVTQTNLPEYARPYFENVIGRAQTESYRPYTPYGGERISGFDPAQTAAQQSVLGMQSPGQFATGTSMTGQAGQQSLGYGAQGSAAGQQAMGYGAQGAATGQQAMGYGATGAGLGALAAGMGQQYAQQATNPQAMSAYMSPYVQNVMDVQKAEAVRNAQQANLAGNLGAARQGTYGGARQLLAQTERSRALGTQLGNIDATGMQRAFEQAQQAQQYGANLGLQGYQTGLQGMQTGLQGVQAAQHAQQLGIQGAQAGMQGAQVGLQGAQQYGQAGAQLADIGVRQQATDLSRFQAQAAAGAEQRALQQQRLDMGYADFLRQRDYPMEQLGYYSNLLRGLPVGLGSTATTYAPPPNATSQLMGLGTGAYALNKLMNAKGGMIRDGMARGGLATLGLHQMNKG